VSGRNLKTGWMIMAITLEEIDRVFQMVYEDMIRDMDYDAALKKIFPDPDEPVPADPDLLMDEGL
jgi:hypothetical protein